MHGYGKYVPIPTPFLTYVRYTYYIPASQSYGLNNWNRGVGLVLRDQSFLLLMRFIALDTMYP